MNSRPSVDSTIQNSNIKIFANLQRLLINIFDIQKGDIVIAKSSSDPKSNICKRIIALEGDKTLSNNPSGTLSVSSWVYVLCIYFRLSWVFVAALRFCTELHGLLSCGPQALECSGSEVAVRRINFPVLSFPTRD